MTMTSYGNRILGAVALAFLLTNTFAADRVYEPRDGMDILGESYTFTEGPAVDPAGNVYFSDVWDGDGKIYYWDAATGEISLYIDGTQNANGLYLDNNGNLIACEAGGRRVVSYDKNKNLTVLAEEYQGKKLNSPNDVWVAPDNGIYFSDPRYGKRIEGDLELDAFHVFYISPDRQSLTIVADDVGKPNGVLGTPDGKHLFVADTDRRIIWKFDIEPDGTLSNQRQFHNNRSDGLALDAEGNLYITEGQKVHVLGPDGSGKAQLFLPERPTNATFAGPDRQTLFVTARKAVYTLPMKVEGATARNWETQPATQPTTQPAPMPASRPGR